MMKNNSKIIFIMAMCIFVTTSAMSQVNSSFSYQGELLDNGVPANGQYDINLDILDGDSLPWGSTSVHSPVEVVNGLFSVNASFGISFFAGYSDFTVTVSIRKTSDGPGGAFTTLGSQVIQAVPLATNLTNGIATTGQVLTFNGFMWSPAYPDLSPWTIGTSRLTYMGDIGIGTPNPLADLHIEAESDADVMRVRVDGLTKFYLNGNGGTSIGTFSPPPTDGLLVTGDVKQSIASNGLMKYMVRVYCAGSASSITRSYNGISNGAISSNGTSSGKCIIDFPSNISNKYFQVSAMSHSSGIGGVRVANCTIVSGDLSCVRFNPSTGVVVSGEIMVLVY